MWLQSFSILFPIKNKIKKKANKQYKMMRNRMKCLSKEFKKEKIEKDFELESQDNLHQY